MARRPKPAPHLDTPPDTTRAAVIAAAGPLFALHGFAGVTARQVAAAANVSLSVIPYHFGSMQALYRETLLEACRVSPRATPLAQQARAASPRVALQLAARWVTIDLTDCGPSWQMRLLMREDFSPSSDFADVLDRKFLPEWTWLCQTLAAVTRQPPSSPQVRFGVIAMYHAGMAVLASGGIIRHLAPDVVAAATDRPDDLAATLAEVAVHAVRTYEARFSAPAPSLATKPTGKSKARSPRHSP